jgi:hypothetical protein
LRFLSPPTRALAARRACPVALAAAVLLVVPGAASAARVDLPISPVTKRGELAGPPLAATIRLTLPDGGTFQRDNVEGAPEAFIWIGPWFRARGQRCRLLIDLAAFAARTAEPDPEERVRVVRGAATFRVRPAGLDDTRAIAGSADFAVPDAVTRGDPHRHGSVTLSVVRGTNHCIRPLRRRGEQVVGRALRSIWLLPSPA